MVVAQNDFIMSFYQCTHEYTHTSEKPTTKKEAEEVRQGSDDREAADVGSSEDPTHEHTELEEVEEEGNQSANVSPPRF